MFGRKKAVPAQPRAVDRDPAIEFAVTMGRLRAAAVRPMEDVGVAAVQDDRTMADGRPAYAWYNEIMLNRSKRSELDGLVTSYRNLAAVLRVVESQVSEDFRTGDIIVRLKRSDIVRAPNTEAMFAAATITKAPEDRS